MSRHRTRLVIAAAVAAFAVGGARAAHADDRADCSFLEFTGTTAKDAAIDGDLKPLEKKLKKPPFSAWNVFKILTKLDKTLAKQKAEAVALKTGTASAILRERTPTRVNLGLTLDGADGKRVVDTKPDMQVGDWLVIGTNANNDGHFLAIMCK